MASHEDQGGVCAHGVDLEEDCSSCDKEMEDEVYGEILATLALDRGAVMNAVRKALPGGLPGQGWIIVGDSPSEVSPATLEVMGLEVPLVEGVNAVYVDDSERVGPVVVSMADMTQGVTVIDLETFF